jgi:tetratricopeptide (TPR) repeat protein
MFYKAIDLDPDFAAAYGMAAFCYNRRKASRWVADPLKETAETALLVRRALELGRDDAIALFTAGNALAYVIGDIEQGAAFINQALVANPNLAMAVSVNGWMKLWLGELDAAIELKARAMRLSPCDPQVYIMETATALAHLCAGRYDDARAWAGRAFSNQPRYIASLACLAGSNALTGRMDEASKAMSSLRQADPTLRVSNLREWTPFRRPEHSARWAEGLQKAGLPEE